jgi:hypothetical protein
MVACVVWGAGGGLFDIILERGDSKAFKNAITEVLGGMFEEMANMFDFCSSKGGTHWWKWCGDDRMCSLGCEGGCLISFWKEGTPTYFKCHHRGFGGGIW